MTTYRRRVAEALLGKHAGTAAHWWRRLRRRTPWDPSPSLRATRAFVRRHGFVVRGGPFAGMLYPEQVFGATTLVPRLLGSYEAELHRIIEEVLAVGYDFVVDVGCGDGYYAVGLALKMREATVFAFDADPAARDLCRRTAELNEVHRRVHVFDHATPAALGELGLNGRVFCLFDCEGCEVDLVDPSRVAFVERASMLVEVHDFIVQNASASLASRMARTHDVQLIRSEPRSMRDFPLLAGFGQREAAAALDEGRPTRMTWAWMKPKAGRAADG